MRLPQHSGSSPLALGYFLRANSTSPLTLLIEAAQLHSVISTYFSDRLRHKPESSKATALEFPVKPGWLKKCCKKQKRKRGLLSSSVLWVYFSGFAAAVPLLRHQAASSLYIPWRTALRSGTRELLVCLRLFVLGLKLASQ